jgi:hypothetical protein
MGSVRRVVTAQPKGGRSVVAKVEDVEPLVTADVSFHAVWGWDGAKTVPVERVDDYEVESFFPPPDGVRVTIIDFPPPGGPAEPLDPAHAERLGQLTVEGGRLHEMDETTGMHSTNSIEIGFVIEGAIKTVQDDGDPVVLTPGDVIVQNGTRHTWHPHGDMGCRMGFVVVGAERP